MPGNDDHPGADVVARVAELFEIPHITPPEVESWHRGPNQFKDADQVCFAWGITTTNPKTIEALMRGVGQLDSSIKHLNQAIETFPAPHGDIADLHHALDASQTALRLQYDRILEARRKTILYAFAHCRLAINEYASNPTRQAGSHADGCMFELMTLLVHVTGSSGSFRPMTNAARVLCARKRKLDALVREAEIIVIDDSSHESN